MVEAGGRPGGSVVAGLAGLREAQLHMIRVIRALVIVQMARPAGRVGQVVVVVLMAVRTLPRWHPVRSGQRKAGRRVVKLGIQPVVETVALFAGRREVAGHVIRVGRSLELGCVTAIAIGRHRAVLAQRSALVASVAIDGGVCSE